MGFFTRGRVSRWLAATTAVVLATALSIAAAGCGSSSGGSDTKSIFMVGFPAGDDFYYTVEQGVKREAERLGVDLEIQRIAKYEPSAELSVLNAAVVKRPDAILIDPLDVDALQAPLENAADQGIRIILFDNTTRDPSVAATFVSSDVVELGRNAAREQLMLLDGKGGKLFYQSSLPGTTFFDNMYKGWMEIIDEHPEVEQLPRTYSEFEPEKAQSQMEAQLTGNPDLVGGFSGVFLDQEAIVEALKRAGAVDRVKTVGTDGAPQNIDLLREGTMDAVASVAAQYYGPAMVKAAVAAIEGKSLPAKTVIGQCILTAQNLDDPANAGCIYDDDQTSA
jgi:ribose transport system substrate-binding protein